MSCDDTMIGKLPRTCNHCKLGTPTSCNDFNLSKRTTLACVACGMGHWVFFEGAGYARNRITIFVRGVFTDGTHAACQWDCAYRQRRCLSHTISSGFQGFSGGLARRLSKWMLVDRETL
jgi:hypothetical protein